MKILSRIKRIFGEIVPLVFVPKCVNCQTVLPSKDMVFCDKCQKVYLLESKMPCKACNRAHKMCTCRINFIDSRFALTHVTGYDINLPYVSKSLILSIKDDKLEAAIDFMADEMLLALRERYLRLFERTNVVITYVPRSERAKREAGHDQSKELALRIAEKSGAVFMPLFKNNGKKKQKTLGANQRMKNAIESYTLLAPELKLSGQTVVIVDDIVTTGASIGACAALTRKAGAKAVIALSAAKTVSGGNNKFRKKKKDEE